MNYLAFDIETSRLTPAGENWLHHRPLGISCYALAWQTAEGIETRASCGRNTAGAPQAQMRRDECCALVEELHERVQQGYTLLTWNGLGFDFDVLAEESGMHAMCCALARGHVDMMFHFFCLQGYPIGLDAAATGMGLAGKLDGMDGSQAPLLWQQQQYDKVLEYVAQDVVMTLQLAHEVSKRRQIRWRTRTGKPNRVAIAQWLNVTSSLALPLPDNSWIRTPMTRERFTGWMEKPR